MDGLLRYAYLEAGLIETSRYLRMCFGYSLAPSIKAFVATDSHRLILYARVRSNFRRCTGLFRLVLVSSFFGLRSG